MAKKKNYVTRDDDGQVCLWLEVQGHPVKSSGGEYLLSGSCRSHQLIRADVFKEFIGNLPRKGTCREFKRGEK